VSGDLTEGLALAQIEERACIGCTLCIAACPVDAIVGAAKLMHTVLAGRCTGCALCLPPCPVDCISLVPRVQPWTAADAERARVHDAARAARRALPDSRRGVTAEDTARARRREAVAAALERARARRTARRTDPSLA